MPHIVRETKIQRSTRVKLLEGMFDLPVEKTSRVEWQVELPLEAEPWQIGLIVGPSGCGKSTIARELFGEHLVNGFEWPADRSIVDGFPTMPMKDIVGYLSSVGFSSPPSWLRPFHVLSNGEQFRATMARALAERRELVAIDEFTSVVDRTVAQIGSHAIGKAVRRRNQKLVAVSCHYDIVDWLDPDWVYEPAENRFQWRRERRRPPIELTIIRCASSAWQLFRQHHYLNTSLLRSAFCFVALVEGQPAAFTAAISKPLNNGSCYYAEHRTVCLPDFQGAGIGQALSAYVGSLIAGKGRAFHSTTSHPAMIAHRRRSPLWECRRKPSHTPAHQRKDFTASGARGRLTASFKYVGPARRYQARQFGIA